MPMYDYQCNACNTTAESLEDIGIETIKCSCGSSMTRITLKPPTWKFAEMKNGKWNGNSADILKKMKNKKK